MIELLVVASIFSNYSQHDVSQASHRIESDKFVVYENAIVSDKTLNLIFETGTQRNLQKLKEISLLEENWNGYGAKPFSSILIRDAENVIRGICTQPEIFPTADDTIQLEFEKTDGSYLEIQISENDTYEVFCMTDKQPEELFIPACIDAVNTQVRKFYAS